MIFIVFIHSLIHILYYIKTLQYRIFDKRDDIQTTLHYI